MLMTLLSISKPLRFEQYTSTRLLAQFDDDLQQVNKISMRISTGNVIGPRYKIRLLRIRFTPLERPERSVGPAHLARSDSETFSCRSEEISRHQAASSNWK